ncbi:MAG: DUF1778 domain-containing protein [Chromatiaceae bacterium]|nr:DUF1778 domain-containing protein [Chromatiaceae bacterium]MCF7995991.1 DUF1778 domain-containing protein [Chromatiaceae bacterium]MCF8016095.1 DUF1778 domain-containing protein [Chromatiaceae bacterium]
MPNTQARSSKLDLRLTPEAKARLSAAARERNQSVSQFVLSSALERADETLADRQHFGLDAEHWSAFMAALERPPRALPRLERLLHEPTPFDPPDAA